LNDIYTEKALDIWRERPLAQIRYGIDKVLIAFGLKTNSPMDSALGFITLGSIFSSILLIAHGRFRPLGAAFGATDTWAALYLDKEGQRILIVCDVYTSLAIDHLVGTVSHKDEGLINCLRPH
jgi:hypothetical protein